jgi:hypothetical protein
MSDRVEDLMRWQDREVCGSGSCFVIGGALRWVVCIKFMVLIGLVFACMVVLTDAARAIGTCPNEAARTGPSAALPDCRAYELVTPADKSSAVQDMDPSSTYAIAAEDGERLALKTLVTFGPTPQLGGSFSVFTRTPSRSRWEPESVKPVGSSSTVYEPQILSPELTQVGVSLETQYPFSSSKTFQVGVPGGPFATVAATSREDKHGHGGDDLLGASSDFSHVVFGSIDHTLLSATPTGTDEDAYDLYEWTGGGGCGSVNSKCKLVNVKEGKIIGKCGATLGGGELFSATVGGKGLAHNAVSADGSKIFFTAPDPVGEGEGCPSGSGLPEANAVRLYMYVTETVEGSEESKTVEVAVPESKEMGLSPSEEEMPTYYQGATADGSKVFFLTDRALTPEAVKEDAHLYEYDTEAGEGARLKLIFQSSPSSEGGSEESARTVFSSRNGSVVYFYRDEYTALYRYEEGAGQPQRIASLSRPFGNELPYSTPNGEFFTFVSEGVAGEPRGAGQNEIYRYDHTDGSVMCVSCGSGSVAPTGNAYNGESGGGLAHAAHIGRPTGLDENPERIIMSADGSEVFFDSTARLVPQAVNARVETVTSEGVDDIYEWETDGAGGCSASLGCTYLISQGNSQTSSELVGASVDGNNVFFMTRAQLVPQDTDTSNDIYDARVDGGFPAPAESTPCLGDTCLSPSVAPIEPTLSTAAYNGVGNVVVTATSKTRLCGKGKVRQKGKCVKRRRARQAARRAGKHNRGASK